MNYSEYIHWFIAGLFVAALLSTHALFALALAVILILVWGDFIIPLLATLLVDTTFVDTRELHNLYGFTFTIITLVLTAFILPIRKFLKF